MPYTVHALNQASANVSLQGFLNLLEYVINSNFTFCTTNVFVAFTEFVKHDVV